MSLLNPFDFVSKDSEQESYIEELVKKIKADKEFYNSLSKYELDDIFLHDNINMINQYYEDRKYCENCPGLDKCNKENSGFEMSLNKINNKFLQSSFGPCPKAVEQMRYDRCYLYKDFRDEFSSLLIEDIEYKLNRNRTPIIAAFMKIINKESNRWIYLYGNNGVGKSYIATALSNSYVHENEGTAGVLDTAKRFKELMSLSINNTLRFNEVMDELIGIDCLVLDDFGNEFKSEYVRDTIVIPLLNERLKNNKTTIFTSEFTIEEIAVLYNIGNKAGYIKAKQLKNILMSACEKEFDLSGVNFFKK